MPGKIFISYRREDMRDMAARIRDWLAREFGAANLFMDVDNLLIGQRFDEELKKALATCDVFIAVLGPRWMDLLGTRGSGDERDYVRDEIAAALQRKIVVVPVLVEGTKLPRAVDLPEDIRDMVLHQKHDVSHEHFSRDAAALASGIRAVRKATRGSGNGSRVGTGTWGWVLAGVAGLGAVTWLGLSQLGVPVGVPKSTVTPVAAENAVAEKAPAAELERQRLAAAKDDDERRQSEAATKNRADEQAAQVKAEQEARARAEAEKKRVADLAAQSKRELEEQQKAAAAAADSAKRTEQGTRQKSEQVSPAMRNAEEAAQVKTSAITDSEAKPKEKRPQDTRGLLGTWRCVSTNPNFLKGEKLGTHSCTSTLIVQRFDGKFYWASSRGNCVSTLVDGTIQSRVTFLDKLKLWFDGDKLMTLAYSTSDRTAAKIGEPQVRHLQNGKITGSSSGKTGDVTWRGTVSCTK